jgi:hypothetical protein
VHVQDGVSIAPCAEAGNGAGAANSPIMKRSLLALAALGLTATFLPAPASADGVPSISSAGSVVIDEHEYRSAIQAVYFLSGHFRIGTTLWSGTLSGAHDIDTTGTPAAYELALEGTSVGGTVSATCEDSVQYETQFALPTTTPAGTLTCLTSLNGKKAVPMALVLLLPHNDYRTDPTPYVYQDYQAAGGTFSGT